MNPTSKPLARVCGFATLVPCWPRAAVPTAAPSTLFAYGYSVLPEPQEVQLNGGTFSIDAGWRIFSGNGVALDVLHELEVFLSIAQIYRENLDLFRNLATIESALVSAESASGELKYQEALDDMDNALQTAYGVRAERNRVLQNATNVWYKSWYPRVAEANGRRYLLVLNSVQDYRVGRTLGKNYLIQRGFLLPFGRWFQQLQGVRNRYAALHNSPANHLTFDWQDDQSLSLGSSY